MTVSLRTLLLAGGVAVALNAAARDTYNFNSDWRIEKSKQSVTLPRATSLCTREAFNERFA